MENRDFLDRQFTVGRIQSIDWERDKQRRLAAPRKPHVQFGFLIRRFQLSFACNKEFKGEVVPANEGQVTIDEPQRPKILLQRHWAKSPLSARARTTQSRWIKAFDEDLIQYLVWKGE